MEEKASNNNVVKLANEKYAKTKEKERKQEPASFRQLAKELSHKSGDIVRKTSITRKPAQSKSI